MCVLYKHFCLCFSNLLGICSTYIIGFLYVQEDYQSSISSPLWYNSLQLYKLFYPPFIALYRGILMPYNIPHMPYSLGKKHYSCILHLHIGAIIYLCISIIQACKCPVYPVIIRWLLLCFFIDILGSHTCDMHISTTFTYVFSKRPITLYPVPTTFIYIQACLCMPYLYRGQAFIRGVANLQYLQLCCLFICLSSMILLFHVCEYIFQYQYFSIILYASIMHEILA